MTMLQLISKMRYSLASQQRCRDNLKTLHQVGWYSCFKGKEIVRKTLSYIGLRTQLYKMWQLCKLEYFDLMFLSFCDLHQHIDKILLANCVDLVQIRFLFSFQICQIISDYLEPSPMLQTQRKIFRPKCSLYFAAVQLSHKQQAIHIGMFLNQPII